MAASGGGRLEVAGRWHGIRGRRFVRPALTIMPTGDGEEVRALADLEHKPWAAEEAEPWIATFECDASLVAASQIELSVAPDITIALRRPGRDLARPGERLVAGRSVRAPRAKPGPPARRPAPPTAAEVERLAAELAAATRALELERERRTSLDHALEDERAGARRLRTELGQAQAELELLRAQQAQATATEQDLDAVRRELAEARHRQEQLTHELEQATEAHAATLTELHEGLGALEASRDALAQAQARTGDQMPGDDDAGGPDAPRPGGPGSGAAPGATRDEHSGTAARSARPVNPSLRHRTYWAGRFLALLLLGVVVAAIWIVIHSTIVH